MQTIIIMSESANKSFGSYISLFLWVKFVKVGYTTNVSLEKNVASLYKNHFVFFPLNNSPDVGARHISEWYQLKNIRWFQCILALMLSSSSFYSFLKHFLREFIFQWGTLPAKTSPEKSEETKWWKFNAVLFLFSFGT